MYINSKTQRRRVLIDDNNKLGPIRWLLSEWVTLADSIVCTALSFALLYNPTPSHSHISAFTAFRGLLHFLLVTLRHFNFNRTTTAGGLTSALILIILKWKTSFRSQNLKSAEVTKLYLLSRIYYILYKIYASLLSIKNMYKLTTINYYIT